MPVQVCALKSVRSIQECIVPMYVVSKFHCITDIVAMVTSVLLAFITLAALAGFVGYSREFHSIVTYKKVADTDDDQLYYTKQYLDAERRVRRSVCVH